MSLFCVLDARCVVYDRKAKVPGLCHSGVLCSGCHSRAGVDLNLLRYDYVDLTNRLPLADRRNEVQIFRPKPASRSPMDLDVFTLRSHIAQAVVLAAASVAKINMFGVREGFALDAAVNALRARLDDLAALEGTGCVDPYSAVSVALSGPQVLLLFAALHRRARRMVGLDAPILRIPGECPGCTVPALRRRSDDLEWIWCASCGHQLTRMGYQQLLHLRIGA